MLKILVNFVFKIINKLYSIIFTPLFSVVNALFPDVSSYVSTITGFFNYCSTYVLNALDFVLLPRDLVVLLLDYFLIKFSIQVAISSVKFTMFVYEKLKP